MLYLPFLTTGRDGQQLVWAYLKTNCWKGNVLLRPFRHVLCLCYKTWQGKAGGFFFWRLMLFPSCPAITLCCTARRSHSREYLSCIWPEIGRLISLLLLELLPPFTLLKHLCWGGHILEYASSCTEMSCFLRRITCATWQVFTIGGKVILSPHSGSSCKPHF